MIKSLFTRQSIVMVGVALQQQSSLTWLRCSERRWDHHQRDHNHPHHDHNHNCFDHYSHHPPNQSCHHYHYHRCKTMWRTVVSTSGFFSSSLKGAVNIVHSCSGNITNPPAKITIFEAKQCKTDKCDSDSEPSRRACSSSPGLSWRSWRRRRKERVNLKVAAVEFFLSFFVRSTICNVLDETYFASSYTRPTTHRTEKVEF